MALLPKIPPPHRLTSQILLRKMKKLSLLFSVSILCSVQALLSSTQSELQNEASSWHKESQQPSEGISIGEIKDNERVYASAGKMSLEGEDIDENTLFEMGSITKVFTGILLADTVLQGKASLEDSIAKHLPSGVLTEDSPLNQVTLLQLSTHTSGLPRLPNDLKQGANQKDPYAHYSREHLWKYLGAFTEDDFEKPGTYAYSNLGVGLLGEILATIHNTEYETLLKDRILSPLNMNTTFVQRQVSSVPKHLKSRFAKGHVAGKPTDYWRLNAFSGAGAMVSSAVDLLNFAEANWSEKTPEHLKQAFELALEKHSEKVGLGWHFMDGKVSHSGRTGGFRTNLTLDVANKTAKVKMMNSAGMVNEVVRKGNFTALVGFWEGKLDLGPRKLRLVMHVGDRGETEMFSIDQGGTFIPAMKSSLQDDQFIFIFPSINGEYRGSLQGGEMKGTWTQGGDLALNMTHSKEMPESLVQIFRKCYTGEIERLQGFWSGKIGGEDGLFVYLEVVLMGDFYTVKIWTPTQTPLPIGVSKVVLQANKLTLESKILNGIFEGELNSDEKTLQGVWTQEAENPLQLTWSGTRPK